MVVCKLFLSQHLKDERPKFVDGYTIQKEVNSDCKNIKFGGGGKSGEFLCAVELSYQL